MSWNLSYPAIVNEPAARAREMLAQNTAPEPIKAYVAAGIDGLVSRYGDDVRVIISGHGHLCDGPSSYDVTSATIDVRRFVVEMVAAAVA
jgi:hypothetical protein